MSSEMCEKFIDDWMTEMNNELDKTSKAKASAYNFDFSVEKEIEISSPRFEWSSDHSFIEENSSKARKNNSRISNIKIAEFNSSFGKLVSKMQNSSL
ncbi:unnamed protein product [Blepharisma stoltei]|uniref:Uncharacterized protein n=1 Tax=Blepharisma stoltei TaxID=1481888 RepID=A0AAU9IV23_9CILI|nr:unnamed protein product [Blepharisma stoltei]